MAEVTLKQHFRTRCQYFQVKWWWEKWEKGEFSKYFGGFYLNLSRKFLKFIRITWLWITSKNRTPYKPFLKTFQKSNYLTNPFWPKPIEIHIQKLKLSLSWTNFLFYPNNWLVPLRSCRESNVVYLSFLHKLYIRLSFLPFGLQCRIYFEIYSHSRLPTQNNQCKFCTVDQKATIFSLPSK